MDDNAVSTPAPVKITLLDLDNADVQDIYREMEGQPTKLTPERLPGDQYGEPGTIVLVLVAAQPVIHAIAAWLLKKRRKQTVTVRARVTHPDGSEVDKSITINLSETDSPPEGVIKQLVDGLGISADSLQQS
jgi:hypothetical protein